MGGRRTGKTGEVRGKDKHFFWGVGITRNSSMLKRKQEKERMLKEPWR